MTNQQLLVEECFREARAMAAEKETHESVMAECDECTNGRYYDASKQTRESPARESMVEFQRKQAARPVPAPTPAAPKPDPINHPAHYTAGKIECIDAIEAALTPEEFRGFCKGNVMKYTWRERLKGQNESIEKAQWYLDRLVK